MKPVDNTGSESPPREQKTSLTSQTKKMTELSASVKRRGLSFRLTSPTMSQEVDKVSDVVQTFQCTMCSRVNVCVD